MSVFGVVGWKNSGKTGLVTGLVAEFRRRGLRVATVKHAHHEAETDSPGTDSHRHRAAGAAQVLLATPRRWALMTELDGAVEPPLETLLARLDPADIVLVEGFKRAALPKIEAHRAVTGQPLLAAGDPDILAVASDTPDAVAAQWRAGPVFDLADVAAVAGFLIARAKAP